MEPQVPSEQAVAESPAPGPLKALWLSLEERLRTAGRLVLVVLAAVLLLRTFVMEAIVVTADSMEKTILIGDHILLNKFSYGPRIPFTSWRFPALRSIRRQQIIAFRSPLNPSVVFVKRVIGVPSDRIRILNKAVVVHNTPLSEPYAFFGGKEIFPVRDNFPPTPEELAQPAGSSGLDPNWSQQIPELMEGDALRIPQGHYFVLGDNRDRSLDSRFWGLVPEPNVVGSPMFVCWSYDVPTQQWVTRNLARRLKFEFSILFNFVSKTRWSRLGKGL